MLAPCIARVSRLRLRTSPTKKRSWGWLGNRSCISDCFSSSREKIRRVVSGWSRTMCSTNALPNEPVPPVRRMVFPARSMRVPVCQRVWAWWVMSSMRWRATLAQVAVWGSTVIWLTTRPSTRFSSIQAK